MSRHRTGARSSRRKRSLIHRTGVVFPVAVIAAVMVLAVAVSAYVLAPVSSSAGAAAINLITGSHTMKYLEAERQQLIAMTTATGTLTVETSPKLASPAQIALADPASGTTTGGGTYVPAAPADPAGAEAIAYNMMGSFGFPPAQYYSCLYDIWMRESSWNYDAENPSGAYGIPQALPGDKMASAGADWQTDPATQIRWGLGYIQQKYGNPCNAWDYEEANGYY